MRRRRPRNASLCRKSTYAATAGRSLKWGESVALGGFLSVAHDAGKRDPEPETRRATGEDRRRAADGHPDRADDPLDLAEHGDRVGVGDDDVRVDLADDEDVDPEAADDPALVPVQVPGEVLLGEGRHDATLLEAAVEVLDRVC